MRSCFCQFVKAKTKLPERTGGNNLFSWSSHIFQCPQPPEYLLPHMNGYANMRLKGRCDGVSSTECERVKALEREVQELGKANEILRLAKFESSEISSTSIISPTSLSQ
jgi:hypothetical protein